MIPAGPLSGITVIDMTRVLAGPFATMVLHDLGARVIKVESPAGGDDSRHFGPFKDGVSSYFASLNKGKQSIALDLKRAEDREIFEALLGRADVLVENFRPGTMAKLGFAPERLRQDHPGLIYAACSGFGQNGPLREKPAYDIVVQGMGGVMSITGHPGGAPTRVGAAVGDITAGLYTAIAVSAALRERERTGQGALIDIAMLDCQFAILENAIARYQFTGEAPQAIGNRHPSITPFEAYASADGHIIIAAGNDALFDRLCTTLELGDLRADPRFADNLSRNRHVDALKALIEPVTRTRETAHWLAALEAAGIPCGPINTVPQALETPQVDARNMLVSVEDPDAGPLRFAGNPIKFADHADAPTRGAIPRLDADRAALLAELGLATPGD